MRSSAKRVTALSILSGECWQIEVTVANALDNRPSMHSANESTARPTTHGMTDSGWQ
jgi:hypothetical protein